MAYRDPERKKRVNEFKLRLSGDELKRVEKYLERTGEQLAVEARDALLERVEKELGNRNANNSTQPQMEGKATLQYA